jgi:hypothetical protein
MKLRGLFGAERRVNRRSGRVYEYQPNAERVEQCQIVDQCDQTG